MKKKLVSYMLVVCMLLSMLPTTAWAEDVATSSDVEPLAETPANLDITNGSIVIDGDGYTQGGNEVAWGTDTEHEVTISGTATTANTITVNGGDPTITFNGLNNSNSSAAYVLTVNSDATIKLVGDNLLKSSSHHAILINSGATLTVVDGGSGSLVVQAANNKNLVAGGGLFKLKSGNFKAHGGSSGTAVTANVEINGGVLDVSYSGNSNARGIQNSSLKITGGELYVAARRVGIKTGSFEMTGGTICKIAVDSGQTVFSANTVNITGGNLNGYYTIVDREPTKLYFVKADGSSDKTDGSAVEVVVNKETANERKWSAIPNKDGVIITYLAADDVIAGGHKAHGGWLIGAECTCDPTAFDWTGTASTAEVFSTAVTIPVNVTTDTCAMPIHETYPVWTVSKVEQNGGAVTASEYAEKIDGKLRLKPAASDYTVELKATLGSEVLENDIYIVSVNADNTIKSIDISNGPVTVVAGSAADKVTYSQNDVAIYTDVDADEKVYIFGETVAGNKNAIKIDNCDPSIILDNVTVTIASGSTSPILVSGDSHAKIYIRGTSELVKHMSGVAPSRSICGIELSSSNAEKPAKVTIDCMEGSDCTDKNCPHKLYVYADLGAGIGSKQNASSFFEVNIEGGHIIAHPGNFGTGIGSGWKSAAQFTVNINDGFVEADGVHFAALIGYGREAKPENVKVNILGGIVEATSINSDGYLDTVQAALQAGVINISGTDTVVDVIGGIRATQATFISDEAEVSVAEKSKPEGVVTGNPGFVSGTVVVEASASFEASVEKNNSTVIVPEGKMDAVVIGDDGTMTLPAGTVVESVDGTITTLPAGGTLAADGTVATEGTKITENTDGTVTVTDKDGNKTTITPAEGENVTVNTDGTIDLPEGTVVEKPDGTTTTLPNGGTIAPDGTITADVALDIANGSIVIDADGYTQGEDAKIAHEGDYIITQTDAATPTANTITVNGIATGKTITLDGVNIVAPAKRPAILIAGDATIRMAAGSQNTLTGGQYHPAIEPLNGTTVTVGGAGDGALNAIGGDGETSAIGGAHGRSNLGLNLNNNSRNFGSVVINGGTITAKGGYVTAHGSAIGGTTLGYVRYVTINGGTIYADYDRAIYSSQDDRKGGNIIINGGKIVARNVDNVISTINNGTITIDSDVVITGGAASYNKGGTQYDRTQIKIWGAGAEQKNATVTVTVDSGTPFQTETDENGWISYLYLTDSAQHTINITGADNKTYTTGAFTATAGNVVFAKNTAITDYSEKCTMENSGIVFNADVPSTVSIYDGIVSVNISCPATQSVFEGCYAVEHILSYSYTVEKDGVAVAESEKAQYAELTGSTLTLKRNGTYDVIVTATCNSVSASKTITVTGSGTKALNIGLGPVAIVAGESDGTFTYKQNGTPVFENLQADDIVVITGEYYYKTANINALYIKDCSPTIIFEDVTISDNGNPQNVYLSTILIEGTDDIEDHVTFLISGENYVLRTKNQASAREYCGIEIRNAELTIDCIEGSANCSGENCPHKLVVKSTLADQRGAVIGSRSGESSAGFTLNIDGGMIEVSSSGGSGTAIGTGINAPSSSEVNIIITDGYVEAVVANGDGTAIGAGKNSTQTTVNVAIEGGEVVAKAKRGNICRNNTALSGGATINDALIPAAVDSVTIPADKLDEVTADENGTVTLPAGSTVTKDGKIIASPKGGTIAADGTIIIYGKVTVEDGEGNETTITPPAEGENVTVNPDGTMELPEGTVVEKPDGSTTTLPDGGSMDAEGNTTTEGTTITENTDGSVTVTDKDDKETTITPAEGEEVVVKPDGTVEVPAGSEIETESGTATIPEDSGTVTIPADKVDEVTADENGTVTLPAGTTVTKNDETITLTEGGTIAADGTVTDPTAPPETPENPENPEVPENPETPEVPEKPEKPTPKPPYIGGYYPIVTPDETPADEPTDKPADKPADKPVDKPATTTPVTPPAEEVVTPAPEDEPVVDEPADDTEPSGGNIGLWIGIGIVALAAIVIVLAIVAARKKRK